MSKKICKDEFILQLKELVREEYFVVGKYMNLKSKVDIRHNICGNVYSTWPQAFISKGFGRCKQCNEKKRHEDFLEEVNKKHGDTVQVLSLFKGIRKSIMVKHLICGLEYPVLSLTVLKSQNAGCVKCNNKKAKKRRLNKSHEEFVNEVFKMHGNKFTILSDYQGVLYPITVKHNDCGNSFELKYARYLIVKKGNHCPDCNPYQKKTTDKFKQEVFDKTGDEYTVVGDYISTDDTILMRHNYCGNEWHVLPKHFLHSDSRCNKCSGNMKRTNEIFQAIVTELVGTDYQFLEKYINTNIPILVKHLKCNQVYRVAPKNFLRGDRCWNCQQAINHEQQRKTTEQYKNEVYDLVSDEFVVVSEYKGAFEPINLLHKKCSRNIYFQNARNFLLAPTCRYCTYKEHESKGEKAVVRILERFKGITYVYQFKFKDCKHKKPLRFDFAIFINNKLRGLIEYDGELHYRPIKFFGGKKGYLDTVLRDHIKDDYCDNNNYPLLRIPYFMFENIEEMVSNYIHALLETNHSLMNG
jgi:hypothetical protein